MMTLALQTATMCQNTALKTGCTKTMQPPASAMFIRQTTVIYRQVLDGKTATTTSRRDSRRGGQTMTVNSVVVSFPLFVSFQFVQFIYLGIGMK